MEEKKTILVADDDPDSVEFVIAIIESLGDYNILTAPNGEEALQKAQTEAPNLIVLDVRMPIKDGYEALTELKEDPKTADIPVVMLSNITALGEMLRCEPDKVPVKPDIFVDKPIDPEKLSSIIEQFLENES